MGQEPLMRVVIDTNVMVSALLFTGLTSRLVLLWQRGGVTLLLSREILEEYLRVLAYPKFQLAKNEIKGLIEGEVLPFAEIVHTTARLRAVKNDPSDDKFLECAVSARAKVLLSGDKHLLALKTYRKVEILGPSQFMSRFPNLI
jgi:uncharacterized protein